MTRLFLLLAAAAPLIAAAQNVPPRQEQPVTTRAVCDSFGADRQWCMAELKRQPVPDAPVPRAGARNTCEDLVDADRCRKRAPFVKPALGPAPLLR